MGTSVPCPTPNRLLNNPDRRWDWVGQNSRCDDIPKFLRKLKQAGCLQDSCAYCGVKLLEPFGMWWSAPVLDHVVPQSICPIKKPSECQGASPEQLNFYTWIWDFSNAVLACSGCNGAANREQPDNLSLPPQSLDDFYLLRDKFFTFKWHKIRAKREQGEEALRRIIKEIV